MSYLVTDHDVSVKIFERYYTSDPVTINRRPNGDVRYSYTYKGRLKAYLNG